MAFDPNKPFRKEGQASGFDPSKPFVKAEPAQPTAPAPRSLGTRFTDNLAEAIQRGPTVASVREAFTNPAAALPLPARNIMGGGPQFDIFSALGPVGEATRAGIGTAGLVARTFAPEAVQNIIREERDRREDFQTRSEADPFYEAPGGLPGKVAAAGATLGGQIAGAALDPQNIVSAGRTLLQRAATQGAANAAFDLQAQRADTRSGIQDEVDPEQVAVSGVVGAALPAAGDAVTKAVRYFRRGRTDAEPGTPEAQIEEAEIEQALLDPVVREQLAASGIDETNPRFQQFAARAQARQAEEAARAADPAAGAVPPTFRPAPMAPAEGGGRPTPAIRAARQASSEVDQTVEYRQRLREEAADLEARTRLDPADPDYVDPGALPTAGRAAPEPEAPMRATPEGAFRPTEPNLRGQDEMAARGEAQRADTERTFALAERQRARAGGEIRDTQAAGRPEGVAPQRVLLDDQFPVQVIREEPDGRVTVRRYDPRTGAPEPGAVEYVTSRATLREANYAANPRQAQDFSARAAGPAPPERPRMPGPGAPAREPVQTYRTTPEDPNPGFQAGPDGPMGRSPLPNQPEGPMPGPDQPRAERAQRFRNEEEARARYEQARQEQGYQDFNARARESYKGQTYKTSNAAGPQDADGRFGVDEFGFVRSDAGGPIRFGDQKQTAKWILNVGQKQSPDQVFEIANHPKGGFTARETGRSSGSAADGAAAGQPEPGQGPRGQAPGAESAAPSTAERSAPEPETQTGPQDQPGGPVGSTEEVVPGGYMAPSRGDPVAEPGRQTKQSPDRIPESPARQPEADTAQPRATDDAPPARADDAPASDAPARPGGTKLTSGFDPEDVKTLLLDPAVKVLKKEIDAFKDDAAQVARDLRGAADGMSLAKALDTTATLVRKVWWTNTAAIRAVAAKYPGVSEIREIADMIGTDPGRGRAVAQTYERASQMRAMGMANRLQNVMGEKVKPELEAKVADILSGRKRAVGGTPEEEMARRIRSLLDEQHTYLTDAGVETGYVKGRYYPRVIDETAVLKDADGFKAKAAQLYRSMGLPADQAKFAAEEWYARILGVSDGTYASGTPTSKHTKGRTLPADADKILADFYSKDPRANLAAYFRQTSRAAEFTRRFGKSGAKADEMFNAMLRKGVSPSDVENVRHHFESAVGTLYATRPDKGAEALGWIQTAGVLRLLPRAVIASAAEGLAVGVRAHDVGAGFKAMADSYATLFGMREADDIAEAARMLGIVGDAMNDLVISAQFGGEIGGQLQQKILARFFRTTYLHQVTEAQRLAAARVGQGMISTLLKDAAGGKRQASAKRLLAELGFEDGDVAAVSKWLGANEGRIPLAELTGTKREAQVYRTALQRFIDESIQNPTAADRPQWANHPFGRLAYGITSFMFSFTRNVIIRSAREAKEGLTGKGYTLEDRVRLLTPTLALGVLVAAQSGVSAGREALLNPGATEEKTVPQQTIQNLSRAGVFGNADPFINIAMSARYERDLASSLTGPYLTAYLDSFSSMTIGLIPKSLGGPNTPTTNNAEWQAAKAGYDMIVSPLLAAGASFAPGGPVLRAGYGAGIITGTAPGAARSFADRVAGERTVKPGGGRSGGSSGLDLDTDLDLDDGL